MSIFLSNFHRIRPSRWVWNGQRSWRVQDVFNGFTHTHAHTRVCFIQFYLYLILFVTLCIHIYLMNYNLWNWFYCKKREYLNLCKPTFITYAAVQITFLFASPLVSATPFHHLQVLSSNFSATSTLISFSILYSY